MASQALPCKVSHLSGCLCRAAVQGGGCSQGPIPGGQEDGSSPAALPQVLPSRPKTFPLPRLCCSQRVAERLSKGVSRRHHTHLSGSRVLMHHVMQVHDQRLDQTLHTQRQGSSCPLCRLPRRRHRQLLPVMPLLRSIHRGSSCRPARTRPSSSMQAPAAPSTRSASSEPDRPVSQVRHQVFAMCYDARAAKPCGLVETMLHAAQAGHRRGQICQPYGERTAPRASQHARQCRSSTAKQAACCQTAATTAC